MRKLFYHGKRSAATDVRQGKKRSVVFLVSLVLLFVVTVGGTLAWLIDRESALVNTFIPGEITTVIEEEFDKETKENVRVKNTGNVDAFIRAAIVINWVDADGAIIAPAASGDYTMTGLPGSGWFKVGGMYYHTAAVPANGYTGYLFTKCVPNNANAPDGADHLQVIVLSQAVQTTEPAVAEAWGAGVQIVNGQLAVV